MRNMHSLSTSAISSVQSPERRAKLPDGADAKAFGVVFLFGETLFNNLRCCRKPSFEVLYGLLIVTRL